MFKKPTKPPHKGTNIKNVKALLGKCMSSRDFNPKTHSRSTADYADSKNGEPMVSLYESIIDEIHHSQSHLAFTSKDPLKTKSK